MVEDVGNSGVKLDVRSVILSVAFQDCFTDGLDVGPALFVAIACSNGCIHFHIQMGCACIGSHIHWVCCWPLVVLGSVAGPCTDGTS